MKKFYDLYLRCITGILVCTILFGILVFAPCWFSTILLAGIFGVLLRYEWLPIIQKAPIFTFLTLFYPLMPISMILYFNSSIVTQPLVLKCFAFAFAHDTFCYLFGRIFGTHTIWSAISRGKTWEGFVGGWLSLALLLKIFVWYASLYYILSYTLLISILATTGDLFESFIKRRAGIKDSGNCLPGHGGLLDRFDSSFFLIYFYWLL